MAQRKFEYSDGKSFKFWNVERKGTKVVTNYGRIGTNGQETVKEFDTEDKAIAGEQKLIDQKTKKGYVETGGGGAADSSGGGEGGGGRREFHFISGSSSKFWAIEFKGDSFDVTYGKIGADGRKTTKEFKSEDAAKKAYDKLIEEKTSKGYEEVGDAGGGADDSGGVLSAMMFSTTKNVDDIGEMSTFIGKRVARFQSAKSIKKSDNYVYKIFIDYDDDDAEEEGAYQKRLDAFLENDAALKAQGLVIGNWSVDGPEPSDFIVKTLVKNKDRLPELVALFFGEIGQEESEMSWIEHGDLSPLLAAFPKLEMLRIRGSEDLTLPKLKHDNLRAFALESGGLSKKIVSQICKAKFPKLEYLELWLGTEDYGGNCQVNDLQPILNGKAFPNLKYLGLRNAEIADDIAGVIVNSPIAKQVETLDLSLGTLSDEGANALLSLPTDGNLKRLDIHRHFVSKAVTKKVKALPFTVDASGMEEPDDWGDGEERRFVAVGE